MIKISFVSSTYFCFMVLPIIPIMILINFSLIFLLRLNLMIISEIILNACCTSHDKIMKIRYNPKV